MNSTINLPQIILEDDYIKLVEQWKNEKKDDDFIDPVTMDEIPQEFLLKFRVKTQNQQTIVAYRDVRVLKDLLERSNFYGKAFKDPLTQIEFSEVHINIINEHNFSKNFDVNAFHNKLNNDYNDEIQQQMNNDQLLAIEDNNNGDEFNNDYERVDVRQYARSLAIPVEYLKISRNYETRNIDFIKQNYYDAVRNEVPREHLKLFSGVYTSLLIALETDYQTEALRLLNLIIMKQWRITDDQWRVIELTAWDMVNPLKFVQFVRSKLPLTFSYSPDPTIALRHLL